MGRKRVWPPAVGTHKGAARVWWNGRYHDLGPAGSDQAKAEYGRLLALWAVDPNAAVRRPDDYLVAELCRDYLASADAPTEERARERAVRAVGLLLELHLATAVRDFGAAEFEAWQRHLCGLTDKAGGLRLNRTSVRDLTAAVARVWKWGVRHRRTTWDQYHEIRTVPPPRAGSVREPEPVLAADPRAVAAALPFLRPPTRAMIRLQQLTGARPGELFVLRPRDVLRAGRVELPGVGFVDLDADGVWVAVPERHKKKHLRKPRWLVLGDQARAVLEPFLARDPAALCFSPRDALADLRREQAEERAARGGGSGGNRKAPAAEPKRTPAEGYDRRTYNQAVGRACLKAGVPAFSPYQLRHLHGCEVDYSMGLDAAQASMGHDKADTTKRYTKRSFRAAVDVAKKLG